MHSAGDVTSVTVPAELRMTLFIVSRLCYYYAMKPSMTRSVWCGYANFGYPTTPTVALVIYTSATVITACSHRRHGEDKTVCLVLSESVVWTQLATRQDSFVLKQSKEAFYDSTGCSLYAIKLSSIPASSLMSWDLIQFWWALSRLDPVSNLHLFSVKYIQDCWKRENWKLGPDKIKMSRFVCSCVHTADADKTRQFPCRLCERSIR